MQTLAIPGELCSQSVGEIQHERSTTSYHSFSGSLQIIFQAVFKITSRGERDVSSTYASAVGSLMYAMISSRPDIAYAVSTVSRFMSNSKKQHWEAVKWVLRYLRGTPRLGLVFQRLKTGKLRLLQGYVDANYAEDLDQRRSTTDYVFTVAE